MKKLVLSIVALVAVAMSSSAQLSLETQLQIARVVSEAHSTALSMSFELPSFPSSSSFGTTTVRGYSRSDGTVVPSHVRTMPNSTNWDNYSTSGNSNPFTGSTGSRARDYSSGASNYGSGHVIYSGPRGGQYYNNSRGNKVYVPKRSAW